MWGCRFDGIAGAAIGTVLLYYAIQAWRGNKPTAEDITNILTQVNHDVTKFLELLLIFNSQATHAKLYEEGYIAITYQPFMKDFDRSGYWGNTKIENLPVVRHILATVNKLKIDEDTAQNANILRENILQIYTLISNTITNRMQPKFLRKTKPMDTQELESIIIKLADATYNFYERLLKISPKIKGLTGTSLIDSIGADTTMKRLYNITSRLVKQTGFSDHNVWGPTFLVDVRTAVATHQYGDVTQSPAIMIKVLLPKTETEKLDKLISL